MTEVAERQEVVALQAGADIRAIVPRTIEEVHRLAQGVIKAGLAPDSYKNDAAKVALGIMKSLEVGLPPLTGLNAIAIINNSPSIYGDGAIALVQAQGLLEKHTEEKIGIIPDPGAKTADYDPSYGYRIKLWRKGQPVPYKGEFTVGNAIRAKLWMNHQKDPWIKYPDRMLFNRARALPIRDGFADALHGLRIREEMEDVPTKAPEAPDVSFLDAETVETAATPEALETPAGEPIEPEVVDTTEPTETPPAASAPAIAASDYLESFGNALSHMATPEEVETWWTSSEPTRRRYDEETQRKLSALKIERLKAIG